MNKEEERILGTDFALSNMHIPSIIIIIIIIITITIICLALQPSAGYGLLVHEVSYSHTTTLHSR
jgi:hypothetical protein